ncbi:MAG: hypothetical protein ACOY3E_01315 [Pseudomonadota bacterium]
MNGLPRFNSKGLKGVDLSALLNGVSVLIVVALLAAFTSFGFSYYQEQELSADVPRGRMPDAVSLMPESYAELGLRSIANEKIDTYRLYLYGFKTKQCVVQFSVEQGRASGYAYVYDEEYIKEQFRWKPVSQAKFPFSMDECSVNELREILIRDKVYELKTFDNRGGARTDGQFVIFEAAVAGKYFAALSYRTDSVLAGVARLLVPKISVDGCGNN